MNRQRGDKGRFVNQDHLVAKAGAKGMSEDEFLDMNLLDEMEEAMESDQNLKGTPSLKSSVDTSTDGDTPSGSMKQSPNETGSAEPNVYTCM